MAENVLVSARVPQVKKDASKSVLASLGANTSDLINSAFDYLLERRELPTAVAAPRPSREELGAFLAASTLDVDWGGEASDGDYRALVRGGKRERYESLA
ncbi:hypothetical protein VIN30_10865 [Adlercreutzia sp. R7]|uniref:Type II toxin-antitoxin system antitoxin, RelB/DinJ family n=1 Tax=Adlercreutzia wanghongyangiae TaxID=3111451 RepID=A0ABU6IKJ7_9ACTN|nr:hypothetical protein [Adlercreutzia sp. R7]